MRTHRLSGALVADSLCGLVTIITAQIPESVYRRADLMRFCTQMRRMFPMRLVVRIVAPAVIGLLFASPLMACAMETATLSVSEAQCCKKMKGDCHNSVGPASHRCCRTLPSSPEASTTSKAAPPSFASVALVTTPVSAPVIGTADLFSGSSDSSPHGSRPSTTTILRI